MAKKAKKAAKAAKVPKSKKAAKGAFTRQEWTDADVKAFKTLIKQNTPTPLIASKLNRSVASVTSKAQREVWSLAPTNRSPRD